MVLFAATHAAEEVPRALAAGVSDERPLVVRQLADCHAFQQALQIHEPSIDPALSARPAATSSPTMRVHMVVGAPARLLSFVPAIAESRPLNHQATADRTATTGGTTIQNIPDHLAFMLIVRPDQPAHNDPSGPAYRRARI
jgi:hypothetical protein